MHFHILTIFPNLCSPYIEDSILARAIKNKKIKVDFYNPRDFVIGKYKKVWPDGNVSKIVDDKPYGGGPGMLLRAEPFISCLDKILNKINKKKKSKIKIIILGPRGKIFNTEYAKDLKEKKWTDIIILSGRYEGIDSRVVKIFKAEEISIGDYVLTGGELPAMILVDCISRQIDGVLGNNLSLEEERISSNEFYTRPEKIKYKNKNYIVPKVFLSGNHKLIEERKENFKKVK